MTVMYSFSFIYIFSFEGGLTSKVNTIFCDKTLDFASLYIAQEGKHICTICFNTVTLPIVVFVPLCNEIIHTLRRESLSSSLQPWT